MSKRVAILGGGVAGMSAAHELAERGFDVVVYELRNRPGGKARSMPVPGSGVAGRQDLPGEHGFRFFPGFYRHLPDTMHRIPYREQTVFDNLVGTTESEIARAGRSPVFVPARFPATPKELRRALDVLGGGRLGLSPDEIGYYIERLLVLLTSCSERRFAEYEYISWWDFVGAASRSDAYQKYCADGLTRTCVACRAKEISTRTGGYILLQLLFDLATPGAQVDRVLDGPTNDVWIDPWLDYLTRLHVDYRVETKVEAIHYADGRIAGVTVSERGAHTRVEADYYLAALPVEVMEQLVTEALAQADPSLAQLRRLKKAWMNGVQFYLARDVPLVQGHTLYIDSPWSLTSVSQEQFWPAVNLADYGDGRVQGVLSVDISDWETPGLRGQPAKAYTSAAHIKDEVWAQLKTHLNQAGAPVLEDANLLHWFLDPDIVYPNPPGVPVNVEPLLINTVGSWDFRPEATTRIPNLFLASDYVRTYTDLATMEAANEAARRAVNGILDAAGSTQKRCPIWPLAEPWVFAPLRWWDRWRFKRGRRHDPSVIRLARLFFVAAWDWLHAGWEAFRWVQRLGGWSPGGLPRRLRGRSRARAWRPSGRGS